MAQTAVQPKELLLTIRPEGLTALTPLLREGVEVAVQAGRSLRQTLTEDLGIAPDCVQERVQTVFVNGSPVDDIDADSASPGCTLALAGALPGVAGIAMRRGSPVGVFRQGITHACPGPELAQAPALAGETFSVTLKLFNSVALECLGVVLCRGVLVRAARLQELLEADADALAGAAFSLDGAELSRAALNSALGGLPGLVLLRSQPEAA